jgi:hypothetical protein
MKVSRTSQQRTTPSFHRSGLCSTKLMMGRSEQSGIAAFPFASSWTEAVQLAKLDSGAEGGVSSLVSRQSSAMKDLHGIEVGPGFKGGFDKLPDFLDDARPTGWHTARFKVGDAEAAKAMEALLLDTEFFQNRVQGATKEI